MKLTHTQIIEVLNFIRPDAEWTLNDLELQWNESNSSKPTIEELENGFIALEEHKKTEEKNRQLAKAAVLNKLGLTADEVKVLFG